LQDNEPEENLASTNERAAITNRVVDRLAMKMGLLGALSGSLAEVVRFLDRTA